MCIGACPLEAIQYEGKQNLSRALASAAYGVLSTFKPKKVSYVSFATNISAGCDCLSNPGPTVIQDAGIFASGSLVSVDAAFLHSVDYRVFNEASEVDCMVQVQEAKALGIPGELKPKIVTLS